MVDVGAKEATPRYAAAACQIRMKPETLQLLWDHGLKKGDAFTTAKLAGILAAKKTPELIPLCHFLSLEHVDIRFFKDPEGSGMRIESEARSTGKTGVEMEALMAAAMAALTLYDMAKSDDPGIVIHNLHLIEKRGGKSDYSNQSRDY